MHQIVLWIVVDNHRCEGRTDHYGMGGVSCLFGIFDQVEGIAQQQGKNIAKAAGD
jgi:hypothetical protein